MSEHLSSLLEELVESVEPVTADEARRRAEQRDPVGSRPGWMPLSVAGVSAAAAATVALVLVLVFTLSGRSHTNPLSKGRLDARAVRLVADTSAAALNSGRAHLDTLETVNGSPNNTASVDIAFDGTDLSQTATSGLYPGVPGASEPTVATDAIYVVNGIVYHQVGGKWYAENVKDVTDLPIVPTPATIISHITPATQLDSLGTDSTTGWTHLQAKNPQALADMLNGQVLAGGAGTLTSFDLWVDAKNIAQRMTWAWSGQHKNCWTQTSPATLPPHCTTFSYRATFSMTFSHIGMPQTITPPEGALQGSGPFDDPAK